MTLRDQFRVLGRQRGLIAGIIVLATLIALAYSATREASYQSTAEVLLNRQNIAATLAGAPDPNSNEDPGRYAITQAELARVPAVLREAIEISGVNIGIDEFREQSDVSSSPDSDLLDFEVDNPDPDQAKRLVNAYAEAFTSYREDLDTRALRRAERAFTERLDQLFEAGQEDTELYQSLIATQQELQLSRTLQGAHAIVVRSATDAEKTQPRHVRTAALGFVLGCLLALLVAFGRDALDTRTRSAAEVAERLGLPLLARLSMAKRGALKEERIVMTSEPDGSVADEFRTLRTKLDLANLRTQARTILFAGTTGTGASSVLVNLAVAEAQAGRRVVVIDLDTRNAWPSRAFGVSDRPGAVEVAAGRASGETSLVEFPVHTPGADEGAVGGLAMLPIGLPSSGGTELVASYAILALPRQLAHTADVVFVNAPDLESSGDAIALGSHVDTTILVSPAEVQVEMLDDIRRALDAQAGDKLGLIVIEH